jgi:hypothetical protein
MSRLDLLLNAYHNYDTIYTGLILAAAWVATTSHLLDMMIGNRSKWIHGLFWSCVLTSYIAGIFFVGLYF